MTLCNPITYCKTRYARVYLKNRHFSFFWRISRQLLVQKILGILQLLLEIVTRHGLCATLSSIVFVKSGWDNFAGRRSRLSGLFCNSDRDRIERCWVSANLSPQFHKWPNFCEDFFLLSAFKSKTNFGKTDHSSWLPVDFGIKSSLRMEYKLADQLTQVRSIRWYWKWQNTSDQYITDWHMCCFQFASSCLSWPVCLL